MKYNKNNLPVKLFSENKISRLSGASYKLYWFMFIESDGYIKITIRKLASETNMSTSTVMNGIKELVDHELISVSRKEKNGISTFRIL